VPVADMRFSAGVQNAAVRYGVACSCPDFRIDRGMRR
jgi:hypothetical protein